MRNPAQSKDDPTASFIAPRKWSEWRFYGDTKGSGVKGPGDVGEFPIDFKPAVYEIRRLPGDPSRGAAPQVVYVGLTTGPSMGVRTRLHSHLTFGDSIWPEILEAIASGDELEARYVQFDEPEEVVRIEKELRDRLRSTRYPWNKR